MHINVRDILVESVGYSRAYKITGERPDLATVRLTSGIEGEITISKLEAGLLVRGSVSTEIELTCDRCLRTFTRPIRVSFSQLFSENPSDDDMLIEDDEIDLAPLVEQEVILALPIKILHDPNCPGIENAPEKYTKEDISTSLKTKARITKGPKRGRT
jgi:uncharacterized metal-binding protein YceD (DUF177 family)